MCGIAGICNFSDRQAVDPEDLRRMADSIRHRGPDDEGTFIDGYTGLAHRRLAIIDMKSGHQPMSNEDNTVWIVFNGEIYNHEDLRQILIAKGHRFRTNSDTESILHAYEEYGEGCVELLRGMFAFAIWDSNVCKLFIARDRLGIKPLYYCLGNNNLSFSSEIKALLAIQYTNPSLDVQSLDCFLSLSYVPAPWTLFKGILKLPPGHVMSVLGGQVSIRQYWDIQYSPKFERSESQLQSQLSQVLANAVESHLMSDVPLGVFLSGGLDSAYLVSTMTQQLKVPCRTFSIGYEGDLAENELEEARSVASRFRTEHHEYRISATDFVKDIHAILRHLEEPVASPAIVPLFYLAKAAREHVTVVLSGEGADELLGGYAVYRRMMIVERLHRLEFLNPGLSALGTLLGETTAGRLSLEIAQSLETRYSGISSAFRREEKRREVLLDFSEDRFAKTLTRYHNLTRKEEPLDRMLYFDSKVWLVDDLLLKADKMTMAASMELRVPFLDHKVVEFCARLPVSLKRNGSTSKVLLRRILAQSFPPEFINRRKKGFPVPIAQWFKGNLRGVLRGAVLDAGSMSRRIFKEPFLEHLLAKSPEAVESNARKLWTLYQLEQWRSVFGVSI